MQVYVTLKFRKRAVEDNASNQRLYLHAFTPSYRINLFHFPNDLLTDNVNKRRPTRD